MAAGACVGGVGAQHSAELGDYVGIAQDLDRGACQVAVRGLLDAEVAARERGDLWQVGDAHDLAALGQSPESPSGSRSGRRCWRRLCRMTSVVARGAGRRGRASIARTSPPEAVRAQRRRGARQVRSDHKPTRLAPVAVELLAGCSSTANSRARPSPAERSQHPLIKVRRCGRARGQIASRQPRSSVTAAPSSAVSRARRRPERSSRRSAPGNAWRREHRLHAAPGACASTRFQN